MYLPNVTEFSFSVDDFKNPKQYKNAEGIAVLFTRLLLLEPGTIQSHPDMGVGIYSRYAYSVEGKTSELKSDIKKQIDTYLPEFQGANINVTERDSTYYITIEIDSTVYGITYDTNTLEINANYNNLSSL